MKTFLFLLAALACVGCRNSAEATRHKLQGTWRLMHESPLSLNRESLERQYKGLHMRFSGDSVAMALWGVDFPTQRKAGLFWIAQPEYRFRHEDYFWRRIHNQTISNWRIDAQQRFKPIEVKRDMLIFGGYKLFNSIPNTYEIVRLTHKRLVIKALSTYDKQMHYFELERKRYKISKIEAMIRR